jgi:hypothetical protein
LNAGNVPNSQSTGALAAGSDSFIAVYSGDSNYPSAIGAVEALTVNQGTASVSTVIDNASTNQALSGPVPLGTSVYDTATVSGSTVYAPTGTVIYYFYDTATPVYGTTTAVSSQTVSLSNGIVPNAAATAALAAGGYSYIAVYSGDSNYADSVGAIEPVTVS